jgi:hypothetical protein
MLVVEHQAEESRGMPQKMTRKVLVVKCDNTNDCTLPLQAALDDATADVVLVPGRASSVWHTRPLQINRSNVELRLGVGAVLQARRGFFHGTDDMVLVVRSATNVSITGDGRTSAIRMWRIDYRNTSLYSKAEWRHGVGVYDATNLTISGITIAETGGDGIYLKGVTNGIVRNVTTIGAYRNGMSVISAVNLLVEDASFVNTGAKGLKTSRFAECWPWATPTTHSTFLLTFLQTSALSLKSAQPETALGGDPVLLSLKCKDVGR